MLKSKQLTQELIQSDPPQVLNIKGKDRQKQVNSHKKKRQAELAALSQKGGNSITQTLLTYLLKEIYL